MNFILLINVKMPMIVGIFTFINVVYKQKKKNIFSILAFLLLNVKIPTNGHILTFISRINTQSKCYKQEYFSLFFSILALVGTENFMLR